MNKSSLFLIFLLSLSCCGYHFYSYRFLNSKKKTPKKEVISKKENHEDNLKKHREKEEELKHHEEELKLQEEEFLKHCEEELKLQKEKLKYHEEDLKRREEKLERWEEKKYVPWQLTGVGIVVFIFLHIIFFLIVKLLISSLLQNNTSYRENLKNNGGFSREFIKFLSISYLFTFIIAFFGVGFLFSFLSIGRYRKKSYFRRLKEILIHSFFAKIVFFLVIFFFMSLAIFLNINQNVSFFHDNSDVKKFRDDIENINCAAIFSLELQYFFEFLDKSK